MSPPVTEQALLPLKAGSDVSKVGSSEASIWQEALTTILAQDGAQRLYWGMEVENPSTLRLFIDWDTIDAHKKFMASRDYEPFGKKLGTILDGAASLHHVPFDPHPATAALSQNSAPTTEVVTLFFPADLSSADQAKVETDIKKLVTDFIEPDAEGFKGSAAGWAVEELENEHFEGKAKVFVAVLGWESVEAHRKFQGTESFKKGIALLRDAPRLQHRIVYHVSFEEVQGGALGQQGGLGLEERGAADTGKEMQGEVLNP